MNTEHFDILVIGFGKGGKTLAHFFGNRGARVAVVEQSKMLYGGRCINVSCIPTKALTVSAEMSSQFHFATFSEQEAYYQKAIRQKGEITATLRQKNYDKLHNNPHIKVIDGIAAFISNQDVKVEIAGEEDLLIHADNIIIDTGSFPLVVPIEGVKQSQRVYTSTSMMELQRLPRDLVIIGSGYVGLEFASMYADFGSHVTVFEKRETFLSSHDPEIAEQVKNTLEKRNITFHLNTTLHSIHDNGDLTYLTYSDNHGDRKQISTDAILLAAGRIPDAQQLKLENTAIERDVNGYIKVNQWLQTTVPHIWAVGDINGGPQFTYISLDDYRIIADQLVGEKKRSLLDRQNIPYSVFIRPTFSWIGLSEEEALQQGYTIKVGKLPANAIPRTFQLQEADGILKAVIDARTEHILGCTLFCADSSEIINLVRIVMNAGLSYTVLRDNIFTHPSMSEGFNDLFTNVVSKEKNSVLP